MGVDDYFVLGGEYKDINFIFIKVYKISDEKEWLE